MKIFVVSIVMMLLVGGSFADLLSPTDGMALPKATTMAPNTATIEVVSVSPALGFDNAKVDLVPAAAIPIGDMTLEGFVSVPLSNSSKGNEAGGKLQIIRPTEKNGYIAVAPFAYNLADGARPQFGMAFTYDSPIDKVSVTGSTWSDDWASLKHVSVGGGVDVSLIGDNVKVCGEYTSTNKIGVGLGLSAKQLNGLVGVLDGALYLSASGMYTF